MSLRRSLIALCLLGAPGFAAQPLNTTRSPDNPKSTKGAQLLSQRLTPESRELARLNAGFPANTQAAIDKTLHYLASQQSKDGSWGERKKIETTSLALLAFLGNGESPLSQKHGKAITASIFYLISSSAKQRGKLCTAPANPHHHWPLEHALAVYCLDEKNQKKWFPSRIEELLKNQHPSGQFNPQFDKLWAHPIEKAVALSSLACLILETPWRYHLNK